MKGLTPTKLHSPVIKNQVVKNLERSAVYESPSRAKVDPPRVKLTPSPKKKLHLTPKKIITPTKPSTSGLPTAQESNQTLEFSLGLSILWFLKSRNYFKNIENFNGKYRA